MQCDERQVSSSLGIITFILTFPLSPPGKAFSARKIPFQKDNPTCARSSPVREFISHAPEETLLGIQPNSSLKSLLCDPARLSMGDQNRNLSCQRLGLDQPFPRLKGVFLTAALSLTSSFRRYVKVLPTSKFNVLTSTSYK